ncbi:DUF288 domain-containing protein, partial [Candidatus Pacearchaeota archaeon]|nr:DUF288 domain-containing protein [Candidatus Pacearchaeota archaeon]
MSIFTTVITTIQEPTPSVYALDRRLKQNTGNLLVIGDQKGPVKFETFTSEFFCLKDQLKLPFKLTSLLPVSHYARKNIGYLVAFSRKAALLYETDDDNAPNDNWQVRTLQTGAQKLSPRPWVNVYRLFRNDLIWPRGFPLNLVSDPDTYAHNTKS